MEGTIEYKNELGKKKVIQVRNGVMDWDNLRLNVLPSKIIKHFPHISILKCSYNKLSEIPETVVDSLPELTELHVAHNKLTKLPENIGNWKKLTKLIATNNLIEELPRGFCKLIALECFDITMNPFYEALELFIDEDKDISEQKAARLSFCLMRNLDQAFVNRPKSIAETCIRPFGCLMDKTRSNKLIRLHPVFAKLESEILAGEFDSLNCGHRTNGHGGFLKGFQLEFSKYYLIREVSRMVSVGGAISSMDFLGQERANHIRALAQVNSKIENEYMSLKTKSERKPTLQISMDAMKQRRSKESIFANSLERMKNHLLKIDHKRNGSLLNDFLDYTSRWFHKYNKSLESIT